MLHPTDKAQPQPVEYEHPARCVGMPNAANVEDTLKWVQIDKVCFTVPEAYPKGSIMVGNRYWMPPPRQFQPMFQEFHTQSNCYATSRKKVSLSLLCIANNVWYRAKCRYLSKAGNADSTRQVGRSHNLFTAVIPEHLPIPETWKV